MKTILRKLYHKLNGFLTRFENPQYYWKIRIRANSVPRILRPYYFHKHNELMRVNNSSIPLSTKFANMPTFPHGLSGIFISSGAQVGKDAVIFHQVTIGSNTLRDSKNPGSPVIGDNVYIGAGAKIIGGIHIGNNVRIGANCVVTRDIPDNTTVVLSAPTIIAHTTPRDNSFTVWEDFLSEKR